MEIIGSGKYTSAFVQNGFTYKVLHENKLPEKALGDLMMVEISNEFSGIKGLA